MNGQLWTEAERLREEALEGTENQPRTLEGPIMHSRGDAECGIRHVNAEYRVVWIRGMAMCL